MFLVLDKCTFYYGNVKGATEELLGKEVPTEQDCASLVIAQKPLATGATWQPFGGSCWAEFGQNIGSASTLRACLFSTGKIFFFQYTQSFFLQ